MQCFERMKMPEALYRKYRPQVFSDVVGQESIERTLKNSIEQNKVSHAYMFTGPRGTGKTTMARLLAKALICEKAPTIEPDNTCEECQLIAAGTHPDVYELDAASRTGVESVREEIIGSVNYAPTRGSYKVYIIDEVHMLSVAAFNALLKTLEEPPTHVVFILCTTDPQKVPETIRSRCQCFGFKRIAPEAIVTRLGTICIAEGVDFEGEALDLIAQRAEGGLRNALTSLEQIIAYENGKVTLSGAERLLGSIDSSDLSEIMSYVGTRDIANCFQFVANYVETGADLAEFVRDMSEHVRDLYILAVAGDDAVIEANETARIALTHELEWFGPERASRMLSVLGDLMMELKTSTNQRLSFEIALTRMVRPDSDLTLEALAERIEALEAREGQRPSFDSVEQTKVQVPQGQDHNAALMSDAAIASKQTLLSASSSQGSLHDERVQEELASNAVAQAIDVLVEEVVAETVLQDSARDHTSAPLVPDLTESTVLDGAKVSMDTPQAQNPLANAAVLQRTWQAGLSQLKRKQQAHSVLFNGVRVSYDARSNNVVLAFPQQSTFAFNAAQKPEIIDYFEDYFNSATGVKTHFTFTRSSDDSSDLMGDGSSQNASVRYMDQNTDTSGKMAPSEGGFNDSTPKEAPRIPADRVVSNSRENESIDMPNEQVQGALSGAVGQASSSFSETDILEDPTFSMYDEVPLSVYEQGFDPQENDPASAHDNGSAQEGLKGNPFEGLKETAQKDDEVEQLQALLQLGFGDDITLEEV